MQSITMIIKSTAWSKGCNRRTKQTQDLKSVIEVHPQHQIKS